MAYSAEGTYGQTVIYQEIGSRVYFNLKNNFGVLCYHLRIHCIQIESSKVVNVKVIRFDDGNVVLGLSHPLSDFL